MIQKLRRKKRVSLITPSDFSKCTSVRGIVCKGFEPLCDVFVENFQQRGELGASCAIFADGKPILDICGGLSDRKKRIPWQSDTLSCLFFASHSLPAIAMTIAHSRGWFELSQRCVEVWPEFGKHGKSEITFEELLSHQAGLNNSNWINSRVDDSNFVSNAIEDLKPHRSNGQQTSFHPFTMGFIIDQLMRRIDPDQRGINEFFRREISEELRAEVTFGNPPNVFAEQVATIESDEHLLSYSPFSKNAKIEKPFWFGGRKTFWNRWADKRLYSANAATNAHSLAKIFGDLASGGNVLDFAAETSRILSQPTTAREDRFSGKAVRYHLGFAKPTSDLPFGSSEAAFGFRDDGGSIGFADPATGIGFAYVTNRCIREEIEESREFRMQRAFFELLKSGESKSNSED